MIYEEDSCRLINSFNEKRYDIFHNYQVKTEEETIEKIIPVLLTLQMLITKLNLKVFMLIQNLQTMKL